jgi:hypothetical protein
MQLETVSCVSLNIHHIDMFQVEVVDINDVFIV